MISPRCASGRRQSFVLVIALVVIAMLSAIVAQLSLTSGVAAVVAIRQRDVLAARTAANSVLNMMFADRKGVLFREPGDRTQVDADLDDQPRINLRLGLASVSAYIRPETSKLNLTRALAGGGAEQVAETVRKLIHEHDLPLPDPIITDAPFIVCLEQLFSRSVDPSRLYGPRPHNAYLACWVTPGSPPPRGSGSHSVYIHASCGRTDYRVLAFVASGPDGGAILGTQEIHQR